VFERRHEDATTGTLGAGKNTISMKAIELAGELTMRTGQLGVGRKNVPKVERTTSLVSQGEKCISLGEKLIASRKKRKIRWYLK